MNSLMIRLGLSDRSAATWRQIVRASGASAVEAQEDTTVSVAVIDAAALDDVYAAIQDEIVAQVMSFGVLPTAQGVFGYAELGGPILEVLKETGAGGVKIVTGLLNRELADLELFHGAELVFDHLEVKDTATGEIVADKYLGEGNEDE